MRQPESLKVIAKALKLSVSTIAKALTGGNDIGAETRKRVLEYVEIINQQPGTVTANTKTHRSNTIGVVISEVANEYFSQVIAGIESVAYQTGYHIIITQTHESAERETMNVLHLASRSVDGLLISLSAGSTDIDHLKQIHAKGLPIVFFDRISDDIDTHKVVADNFLGAYQATRHLIGLGYNNIGYLMGSAHLSISTERLAGYRAALAQHNIAFNSAYVFSCQHGGLLSNEVDDEIDKLMRLPQRPDALFIATDKLSTACLSALKKHDINIPTDIAIASFSNSATAGLFGPSLTTVVQPAFQIGQVAINKLIQLIDSKHPITQFETIVLPTELNIRESTSQQTALNVLTHGSDKNQV